MTTVSDAPATPAVADSNGGNGSQAKVGKSALIYTLGMVLSRTASLIMLPVYTRMLSPADYGLLQVLDMTIEVVSILVSAGCLMGVMRFYFKAQDDSERRAVISSAVVLQSGLDVIGSVLMALAAVPIWRLLLHGEGSVGMIYLAAANFTLMSLPAVPLMLMQMQQRAAMFTAVSLVRLVMQLSLNILFLVVLRMGPIGILISTFITNLVLGVALLAWLVRVNGMRVSRSSMRDLRNFGLPYQLVTAGTFVLTFGDRFFIDRWWGLAAVGLYSLAYQFGFLLEQLGSAPFIRAWTPLRFEQVNEPREVRDRLCNQALFQHNLLLVGAAVGMSLFVHPVLRVMSDPAFHSAADIVPLIAAAVVAQIWGVIVRFGIDVSEQTRYSTYGTWTSVVVIIVLYSVMIPTMGVAGAALATLISYVVRFGVFYAFAQRLYPITYEWGPSVRLLMAGAAPVGVLLLLRPGGFVAEVAAATVLFGVFVATTWFFVVERADRARIADLITAQLVRVTARFARA